MSDDDPFGEEILTVRGRSRSAFAKPARWSTCAATACTRWAATDGEVRAARLAVVRVIGAGVGLTNFRDEEPWRPPSLLLEADPPHHDAPRAVLARSSGRDELREPRAEMARRRRQRWSRNWWRAPEFDAVPRLAEAFPLRVFPDAVGIARSGTRTPPALRRLHLFNSFGPENYLVAAGSPPSPSTPHG